MRVDQPLLWRSAPLSQQRKGEADPVLVIIVDDDTSVREALSELILSAGFQPVSFASTRELLDSDVLDSPGCLIVDVRSGLDLQRHLAQNEGDMVQRRWSWPGPNKRPVYNFRSEGREFSSNRCLIVADGFYEFTDPEDPKKKRKDKWLFTKKEEPIFCIAGIWREMPGVGEAFTMLTMEPGPDIAPYHDRRIVILESGLARPFGVGQVADQAPSTRHAAGGASRMK
ncbi:SOS response-associated peptidase family protein [Mesorhizobium sp. M0977]|uniref:SOS response-associated peptidase family protein n=1 Tax=unclassified Mesorhizobium TaxID=325217 RepID=UPI00333A9A19